MRIRYAIALCTVLLVGSGCETMQDRLALAKKQARDGFPALIDHVAHDPTPGGLITGGANYLIPILATLVTGGAGGVALHKVRKRRKAKVKAEAEKKNGV